MHLIQNAITDCFLVLAIKLKLVTGTDSASSILFAHSLMTIQLILHLQISINLPNS